MKVIRFRKQKNKEKNMKRGLQCEIEIPTLALKDPIVVALSYTFQEEDIVQKLRKEEPEK